MMRLKTCFTSSAKLAIGFSGLALIILLSGCRAVPVSSQRLVSKPNMIFSDSVTAPGKSRLIVQIEPGSAFSGGAQAAGCASCK